MAKKKDSPALIIERAQELLKQYAKIEKANKKCPNHPDRIIYMRGVCKEDYEILTNTTREAKAAREPWISTNGYKYCYGADGNPTLYARLAVESYLGRSLQDGEKITYIDKDKSNCKISNLAITITKPVMEFTLEIS